MFQKIEQRISKLQNSRQLHLLCGGKKGLEKESLRVLPDGQLAQTPHPEALGSALTHPYITTDYSEALLELITPPRNDVMETIDFMRAIHQFIYAKVKDEFLWGTSMPCTVNGEESIPIAEYGSSNVGQMKHVYLRGLATRYGRFRQLVSGVHYNYSFPSQNWEQYQCLEENRQPLQKFITDAYFGLARNVLRYQWLITYLFGNSPALCKSFLNGRDSAFQSLDPDTYYEPYATSLRISGLGHTNCNSPSLNVSYNNLDAYVCGLTHAIKTPYQPYVDKGVIINGEQWQLNANILQMENEYYSAVRPKQPTRSGERPTMALKKRGVQYVEIRLLDVDTFSPIAVNEMQLRFMEAFTLFCLLQDSPPLTPQEEAELSYNQKQVASNGRMPGLKLRCYGRDIAFWSWAMDIMAQLDAVCEALDQDEPDHPYSKALVHQKQLIRHSTLTPSAQILAEIRVAGESFSSYVLHKSKEHQATLIAEPLPAEKRVLFKKEAKKSIEKQRHLEERKEVSFESFLQSYLYV